MTDSIKVAFLSALLLAGCGGPEEGAEPEMIVEVRTAQARVEDVEQILSAPANIFPISEAKVASKLTAPIARLGARKGDRVLKGQILAWLRSDDLDAQLAEALAQVADAEANLEKVSAGTLPTEIERAQGELERTTSALTEAKQIFERRRDLVAEGALSERDLLLAKTQYEQAQTANRVAKTALELLSGQSRLQDIRIAESGLSQAKARSQFVEAQLGFGRVESPSPGYVTDQFLYPGDMAQPGTPIFTVMDLSTVVARGHFPEENAGELRRGQDCRFAGIDSLNGGHAGKLTVVNQAVDAARRSVEAWCEIPNRDSGIKAGLFGQVSVVTGRRRDAVTVPRAAVEFDRDRERGVVWSVGADNRAHEHRVRTGVVSPTTVEVLDGIEIGATVVVEGGYGLSEGLAVRHSELQE